MHAHIRTRTHTEWGEGGREEGREGGREDGRGGGREGIQAGIVVAKCTGQQPCLGSILGSTTHFPTLWPSANHFSSMYPRFTVCKLKMIRKTYH